MASPTAVSSHVPAFVYPQLSEARIALYEALLGDQFMCSVSRLEPTPYGWMRERLPTPVFELVDREYWRCRIDIYRYGAAKLYLPSDGYLAPPYFLLIAERNKGKFYSLCKELDPDLSGRQPNGLSPLIEKIALKALAPPPATIGRAWVAYLCTSLLGVPFSFELLGLGGGERLVGFFLLAIGLCFGLFHYAMVWSSRKNKINRLNKLLWPLVAETEQARAQMEQHLQAYGDRLVDELTELLPQARTQAAHLDSTTGLGVLHVEADGDERKPEPATESTVLIFQPPEEKKTAAA